MAGHSTLHQYIAGSGYLGGAYLGADMKGVVLTARAYGVREVTTSKFTNLGGANACHHLIASCFKDEGPGLKRLLAASSTARGQDQISSTTSR
jgi:hypothetical protein